MHRKRTLTSRRNFSRRYRDILSNLLDNVAQTIHPISLAHSSSQPNASEQNASEQIASEQNASEQISSDQNALEPIASDDSVDSFYIQILRKIWFPITRFCVSGR